VEVLVEKKDQQLRELLLEVLAELLKAKVKNNYG
jgi:ribosomal protein L29